MAISAKVKALLNLSGKDHAGLAAHLGISKQALSNKFYRDSFSAVDLVKVAEYTEGCLSFALPDGNKVIIDSNDLRVNRTSEQRSLDETEGSGRLHDLNNHT